MNIGKAIRSAREALGIDQKTLAQSIQISPTSLSLIENGVKQPSKRTLSKIANRLDVPETLFYLLSLEQTDIPKQKQKIYKYLFPSIERLLLEIVGNENQAILDNVRMKESKP